MKFLNAKELAVLEVLENSDTALGSWVLVEKLEQRDLKVSSATIGRALYGLERMGYVKKEGNNGRIITEYGKKTLRDAQIASEVLGYQETLENALIAQTLEEYIQVLQARRAIERETAYLAAENITDEELQEINELIYTQMKVAKEGKSIADIDLKFHMAIAHASRNPILQSLYQMLFPYGQQSEIFENMRKTIGGFSSSSHINIYDALKNHNAEQAAFMMVQHIDGLMRDITIYWELAET